MKLGLKLAVLAGLLATPIFAVDQSVDRGVRRDYSVDSRYEFRRNMERLRADLRREFYEIRHSAWRARMDFQRERFQVQREVRRARAEALRERVRARVEARREILELRRHDRRWF